MLTFFFKINTAGLTIFSNALCRWADIFKSKMWLLPYNMFQSYSDYFKCLPFFWVMLLSKFCPKYIEHEPNISLDAIMKTQNFLWKGFLTLFHIQLIFLKSSIHYHQHNNYYYKFSCGMLLLYKFTILYI